MCCLHGPICGQHKNQFSQTLTKRPVGSFGSHLPCLKEIQGDLQQPCAVHWQWDATLTNYRRALAHCSQGLSSRTSGWIQWQHDQPQVLKQCSPCPAVRLYVSPMTFDRHVTSPWGSDTTSGIDKEMKAICLQYQIASQENTTVMFTSCPGSWWYFAIWKLYHRAFHTCPGKESKSFAVAGGIWCTLSQWLYSLCYIKPILHPQPT